MISIPYDCPRDRNDCRSLALISSDESQSFYCCGENRQVRKAEQDKYTVCFKGALRDEMSHNDKRDLMHNASVIIQALGVIEKDIGDERDWSAWEDLD